MSHDMFNALVMVSVAVVALGGYAYGYSRGKATLPTFEPLAEEHHPQFFVNFRTFDGALAVARIGHGTDARVFKRTHLYTDDRGILRVLASCVWKEGGLGNISNRVIVQGEVGMDTYEAMMKRIEGGDNG